MRYPVPAYQSQHRAESWSAFFVTLLLGTIFAHASFADQPQPNVTPFGIVIDLLPGDAESERRSIDERLNQLIVESMVEAEKAEKLGEPVSALRHAKRALKVAQRRYPESDVRLIAPYLAVGRLSCATHDTSLATEVLERAIALARSDEDHCRSLAIALCWLSRVHVATDSLAEAESCMTEATGLNGISSCIENVDLAQMLHDLAVVQQRQDKWNEARISLDRAWFVYQEAGKESPLLATLILRQLAKLHQRHREHDRALVFIKKLLSTCTTSYGSRSLETAEALNLYCRSCVATRDFASADQYLRESMGALPRSDAQNAERMKTALGAIADSAILLGDIKTAIELYRRQLDVIMTTEKPSHYDRLTVHHSLNLALAQLCEFDQVRKQIELVRGIWPPDMLTPDEDSLLYSCDLALASMWAGCLDEALEHCERGLSAVRAEPQMDFHSLRFLCLRCRVQIAQGEYENAAANLIAGSLLLRLTANPDPGLRLVLDAARGELLLNMGALDKAEPLLRNVVGRLQAARPPMHPSLAVPLMQLGLVHLHRHDYDAAQRCFSQALEIASLRFGDSHPYSADALDGLGQIYATIGTSEQALEHLFRAFSIRRRYLGTDHPKTAESLLHLGNFLASRDDLDSAWRYLNEAYAIDLERLGDSHPTTIEIGNRLAELKAVSADLSPARTATAIEEPSRR